MQLSKRRFGEYDLAKAIAILGLPFVHFMEEAGNIWGFLHADAVPIIEPIVFLTIFGPAVFMFCMGFGMSGGTNVKRLRKNGIQFLIIGYGLNAVGFTIPEIIYSLIPGNEPVETAFLDLVGGDIYIFVGWFYLFYALLRKHNVSRQAMVLISLLLLIVCTLTGNYLPMEESFPATLVGNFTRVNDNSYFPLFGWAIFPVLGILLGGYAKKLQPEEYRRLMKQLLTASGVGFVGIAAALRLCGSSAVEVLLEFTACYAMDPCIAALLVCIAVGCICLLYFAYTALPETVLERYLMKLSSVIMAFYLIQWLLVSAVVYYGFSLFGMAEGAIHALPALGMMLAIAAASMYLTERWGLSFLRFILRISDHTRWLPKKTPLVK